MGSSGGIPDISVRLSAQGVQDVINAFTRVRQEAKTTGTETSASLELINVSLETLSELLPAISLAIVVDKIIEMGTAAFETADDLGKLAEKSGVSASALSVFNLAAAETGVSTDSLSTGIVKLTKASQDAADGVAKPKKAFSDLGITLQDLQTLSPEQLFIRTATSLSGVEAPGLRAQIAVSLFGKAGQELLPVMEKLGTDGFDALQQKAQFLGVYLDANLSDAVKQSKSDFADLAAGGQGAALQFDAGLLPAISGVAEAIIGLAGGSDGFRQWGVGVGNVILTVAAGLAEMVKDIRLAGTEYDSLQAHVNKAGDSFNAKYGFTSSQRSKAQNASNADDAEQFSAEQDRTRILTEYNEQLTALAAAQIKLNAPLPASTPSATPPGVRGTGISTGQADKDAKAYAAYQQSLADNQLALLKTTNQLEESEDKRHFDAGLLSVDDYYDKVEERINENSDAEIAALDTKYAAAQTLPTTTLADQYKKQQTLAAIDTEMTQVNLKNVADLKAAEDDRFKAYEANQAKQLTDTEKLQKASGDTFGAQETALQIEINDYAILLASQGKSLEEINNATAAYQQRGQALIDFNRAQQAGSDAISGLNAGIANIQNQAANGSITNISAQYQINQLQLQSLATLAQIGQQMFINATITGGPAIDAANKFLQANQKLASSITNVTTAQTQLVNQLTGQGYTDLLDFFTAGIDGSKSFADALTDLGNQFAQIVSKMVSQLIIFETLEAIVGWIAPGSALKSNLDTNGAFSANPLSSTGHADGGWTGDVPTNQIAGYVHGQEYVVKAGPAAQNRALLDAMNSGAFLPATRSAGSVVSSSLMADPASSSRLYAGDDTSLPVPLIQIITSESTKKTQKTGPGGQSITQIVVGAVSADIAKGGQIAQTMQNNYGLSRSGVKKG